MMIMMNDNIILMSINHDIASGINMQFLIQELVNYKASSPLCKNNNIINYYYNNFNINNFNFILFHYLS